MRIVTEHCDGRHIRRLREAAIERLTLQKDLARGQSKEAPIGWHTAPPPGSPQATRADAASIGIHGKIEGVGLCRDAEIY